MGEQEQDQTRPVCGARQDPYVIEADRPGDLLAPCVREPGHEPPHRTAGGIEWGGESVLEQRAKSRLLGAHAREPLSSWFVCVNEGCVDPAVVRAESIQVRAGGAGAVLGGGTPVCMACGGACWEVRAGWLEGVLMKHAHGELMSKLGEVCEVLRRGETLRVEPEEIPERAVELARDARREIVDLLDGGSPDTAAVLERRVEQAGQMLDVALKLGRKDALADAMSVMDARDILRGERPFDVDVAAHEDVNDDVVSGGPPRDGTLQSAAWKAGCVLREDPSAGDRPLLVLAEAVRDVILDVSEVKRQARVEREARGRDAGADG